MIQNQLAVARLKRVQVGVGGIQTVRGFLVRGFEGRSILGTYCAREQFHACDLLEALRVRVGKRTFVGGEGTAH